MRAWPWIAYAAAWISCSVVAITLHAWGIMLIPLFISITTSN